MSRLLTTLGVPGRQRRGGAAAPEPDWMILEKGARVGSVSTGGSRGWEFTPTQDLSATAVRFFLDASAGGTAAIVAWDIWRVSDSARLAQGQFASVVLNGWTEQVLGTPVTLLEGVNYIVSTRRAAASSSNVAQSQSLAAATTFNPLVTYVAGRYTLTYSGSGVFPSTVDAGNVWGADLTVGPA